MRRVMIIGAAGSGKSTLARMIGERLGLPVFHMDREVYWLAGWVERPEPERQAQVERITAGEAWVFEGSYSRTYKLREARAEMLIWLDTPLALRIWRVISRSVRYLGQPRPDLADGCTEQLRLLPEFLWFILRTARSSRRKAGALFDASTLPKYRLTSAAEVNAFVAGLAP